MKKILTIIPSDITQQAILRGFKDAFEKLGFFVEPMAPNKISVDFIRKYKPDAVFSFNYNYFNAETLVTFNEENKTNIKNILYFLNTPNNNSLNKKITERKFYTFGINKEYSKSIPSVIYLPLGINPAAYKTDFTKYMHRITFVGNPNTKKRLYYITELIKKYGQISIFCSEEKFGLAQKTVIDQKLLNTNEIEIFKASFKGYPTNEKEIAKIFNSSRINLNININENDEDSLNYKIFEILASGGFLLTEDINAVNKYFDIGRELETFKDKIDLFDKIEFYIKNLNIAQNIALAGRKNIVNSQSLLLRSKKIIEAIKL